MKIPKYLIDAFAEGIRLLVLGVVAYYISNQNLDWTIITTILFRVADKMLHKYGKEENIDWLIKGLVRF